MNEQELSILATMIQNSVLKGSAIRSIGIVEPRTATESKNGYIFEYDNNRTAASDEPSILVYKV